MKVYAVIQRDGTIKRSRRSNHLLIYTSFMSARKQSTVAGDSVVEVTVDLTKAPLFINQRTM